MIQPIEDLSDQTYDPYIADDEMYGSEEDPYSPLHAMRATGDIIPLDASEANTVAAMAGDRYARSFVALSHEAVKQVLNDATTFSNSPFRDSLGVSFGQTLSVMDPPEHTRYRKILQKAFRPNVVVGWGDGIVAPVIDDLVSKFEARGRAELVEEFCRPYPFNVIYRMLGLPEDDI